MYNILYKETEKGTTVGNNQNQEEERLAFELVLASEVFDDNNEGYEYGVQYGTYDEDNCSIDTTASWFKTEEERQVFITNDFDDYEEIVDTYALEERAKND